MDGFPQRLAQLVAASGESSKTIAARAGISAQYLSDLANGRRDAVSFAVAEGLAAALDCDPCFLNAPVTVRVPYATAIHLVNRS